MARATSVLPAPCTPSSRMPLGTASPNRFASGAKARLRLASHVLRLRNPPTSARFSSGAMYSRMPSLEQLPLHLQHRLEPAPREGAVAEDGLGDGALGLQLGEALHPFDEPVEVRRYQTRTGRCRERSATTRWAIALSSSAPGRSRVNTPASARSSAGKVNSAAESTMTRRSILNDGARS